VSVVTDASRPMTHWHECFCHFMAREVKPYFDFARMRYEQGDRGCC